MPERTPRTMAEAFGHHSNNTFGTPRTSTRKKSLRVLCLLATVAVIVVVVAMVR